MIGTLTALLSAIAKFLEWRIQNGDQERWERSLDKEAEIHEAIMEQLEIAQRKQVDRRPVVLALRRRLSIQQGVSAGYERKLAAES